MRRRSSSWAVSSRPRQRPQLGLTPFELRLLPPQGVLGPLAVGHVPPDGPVVVVAALVPDERHAEADVQQAAVPTPQSKLHVSRPSVRAGRLQRLAESGGAAGIVQLADRAPEHLRPPVAGRAQQRGVALRHPVRCRRSPRRTCPAHPGTGSRNAPAPPRAHAGTARATAPGRRRASSACLQFRCTRAVAIRGPGDIPSSQAPRDIVSCTQNRGGARLGRPGERWRHDGHTAGLPAPSPADGSRPRAPSARWRHRRCARPARPQPREPKRA